MNKQIIFIALYRALECIEEETGNEKLSEFINIANPYVFKDRKSADPTVYAEFCDWLENEEIRINEENSFEVAKRYVLEKTEFGDILNDISAEEWNSLIDIIKKEEPELK